MKKNLKYAIALWRDLRFYIWNGHGIKINRQLKKIESFRREHPICDLIARIVR